MVAFNFSIEGEEQVSRMLSRTTEKIEDLTPFFDDALGLMAKAMASQFDTQGGRTGGWAPLSPAYAIAKMARWGSKPILEASGRMRQSLEGGPGNISKRIGNEAVEFGTSVPYAQFHQRGTSRMPQRRILDLLDDDRRQLMKALQRHLFINR